MKIKDLRYLINVHMEKEEYQDALESCQALADEYAVEMTFDDIFRKGFCHLQLDEDAEAVHCFDEALEKEPDNLMALTNKGTCLYNLGSISEAFQVFNKVMKLNPGVFPPWYYIGMFNLKHYSETGDIKSLERLVNAYRRVFSIAPDVGSLPMHDPVKDIDYQLETFVLVHGDVRDLSVDEMTAID
ncbi:MAG: tetratricopeptide repeat protein [Dehalococcoidia bacterium]|nr:tetratricopeptide repeat protein [Dehalococcoidia bacterium]